MTAFASSLERGRRAVAAAVLFGASSAGAGATSSAELTWLLASGDLLRREASPAAGEEAPYVAPYEPLASARSGRENRLRLQLAQDSPGFTPQLETRARLRLELGLAAPDREAVSLRDGSSWLGAYWRAGAGWSLGLRAFPLDTNYERLGHLHALDWGGSDAEGGESSFVDHEGGAPGLELVAQGSRVELALGMRWARPRPRPGAPSRLWGALLRARWALDGWRADLGLGYFERAVGELAGARSSFVEGATLRLVSSDRLEEPVLAPEPFRPPSLRDDPLRLHAPEAQGAAVAAEGVVLAVRSPAFVPTERAELRLAPAAALYGSVRRGLIEAHAVLAWRSLAFVLRNQPPHDQASSGAALQHAELAAWLGASLSGLPLHLTPGVELGVLLPATLEVPSSLAGFSQSFVVRESRPVVPLPVGSRRLPVAAGRVALRLQASRTLALAGFVDYERDPNRVRFQDSPQGAFRTFAGANRLSVGASAQARF